jgi:poly(3-hydroxybutyrate) depolymerase
MAAVVVLIGGTGSAGEAPPAREVVIPGSGDGSVQPALAYFPAQSRNGRAVPLLVCVHSWSAHFDGFDGLNELVRGAADRGWAVISPEFRGPNSRPQACASALAMQDVLDSVAFAERQASIDRSRIYLVGGSGGGHMALTMAQRAPRLWAGVSAWVPISDLAAWHAFCKQSGFDYAAMIEASCGGSPDKPEAKEQYRLRSPIYRLDGAKGVPIDLNAGIRDGHGGAAVPISHTLNAFNALARVNGFADKVLPNEAIAEMTSTARVTASLADERVDEPGRRHRVLFRRSAGPVRVTLFDGGHEIDPEPALAWLARQVREDTAAPSSAPASQPQEQRP